MRGVVINRGSMPTKWRLNELMARHRVSGKDLAKALKISPNAVYALKGSDKMPRIDGDRLDEIAAALTSLSKIGGVVKGVDLLENLEDEA
jgi:putative transcriptional regulator